MTYFVYENRTHKRVRVHRSEWVFCNDGRGLHWKSSAGNDRWHGPFGDRQLAVKTADRLDRDDTRLCAVCRP